MDRTEHSLKAFIGLNRALDTLEKIVQQDVKNYGLNVTEFAVLELLYSKVHNLFNVLEIGCSSR